MIIPEVLFWLGILALVHSYLLYPLILGILDFLGKARKISPGKAEDLPNVHLFMAAYNEEEVIGKKLQSVLANDYPPDKLHVWVGSDASDDRTGEIIESIAQKSENLHYYPFTERTGKSGILNTLHRKAGEMKVLKTNDIFILTDANVIFENNTISLLVKEFQDNAVGLAGAYILNTQTRIKGISIQEKRYIQRENKIKYLEGKVWGTMMGAFGACYAIRSHLFEPIPPRYLMEDFYITMSVLRKGKYTITSKDARCLEDVSNKIAEEFKRKIRISAGNFQNLRSFAHILWPPWTSISFSFLSHKVLRWFGPLFIIMIFITGGILSFWNEFYRWLFIIQCLILIMPLFDFALKKLNIHIIVLRFISYFYAMNLALLVGLIQFIKGVKTNVWRPTARNQ